MDNEIYTFALKNTIAEIGNICPDITNAFMFKRDSELLIGDEKTPEKTIKQTMSSLNGIFEKSTAVGDVKSITINCDKGRINISSMDEIYFTTVTTRKADAKYVDTVTRILIPTILRLLEKISPAPLKNSSLLHEETAVEEPLIEAEESVTEEPEESMEVTEPEIPLEIPSTQLMVETLGGLLIPSDTVRIDSNLLSQWEESGEGVKIQEVFIETFGGKTIQCKVKPIKDSKFEGKGVILMPEKMQSALEIKKGELVKVKPVIAQLEDEK